ncbi:MAG: hypothetical protein ACXIU8_00755 [Alkalilacustris sp.]
MLGILFLVALVLVAFVVVQSVRQGRRFIRAALFLHELEGGRRPETANAAAAVLFTAESSAPADAHAAQIADARRKRTGESQAQVIGAARARGFDG